jgi:two-component system LytT family sensor kinase
MPSRRRLAQLVALAFLIAAIWTFLGIFFASQEHAIAAARGTPEHPEERVLHTVPSCIAWALLTPVVIEIADRLPLRGRRRLRNALLLFAAAVVIASVRAWIDASMPAILATPLSHDEFRRTFEAVVHLHFLFFGVITGVTNFVRARAEADERASREARMEAELAQAQLRRLRSHLQPHFLFNTLNAITALAHTDAHAARVAIEQLAELLETLDASATRVEVPLAEELEFVERYLDLQKVRFGALLRTEVVVDEHTLLRAFVPPLVLQPLVENSLVHGIRRRQEGGRIAVRAFRERDTLRLEVRDSGPGCAPVEPFTRGHIGIPATRDRLQYLYRDASALTFRRDGDEFVADIRLPLRFA